MNHRSPADHFSYMCDVITQSVASEKVKEERLRILSTCTDLPTYRTAKQGELVGVLVGLRHQPFRIALERAGYFIETRDRRYGMTPEFEPCVFVHVRDDRAESELSGRRFKAVHFLGNVPPRIRTIAVHFNLQDTGNTDLVKWVDV